MCLSSSQVFARVVGNLVNSKPEWRSACGMAGMSVANSGPSRNAKKNKARAESRKAIRRAAKELRNRETTKTIKVCIMAL